MGIGAVFGWSYTYGNRWAISPIIATEGRWYFNYKRRSEIGKKLLFNAADFFSLQAAYVFRPIEKKSFANINSAYYLVANIGMQRTWGKHINFEFKFGFGLSYYDQLNVREAGLNINLKFGYIFNKAK